MPNILHPKSTLKKGKSRIPYNPAELYLNMLCELINMFLLPSRRVMDPYAGTMTTFIVSIKTGRECVFIEPQEDLFKDAVDRLRFLLPRSICPVYTFAVVYLSSLDDQVNLDRPIIGEEHQLVQ